eukprot:3825533-Amphidinium_carterae.1
MNLGSWSIVSQSSHADCQRGGDTSSTSSNTYGGWHVEHTSINHLPVPPLHKIRLTTGLWSKFLYVRNRGSTRTPTHQTFPPNLFSLRL